MRIISAGSSDHSTTSIGFFTTLSMFWMVAPFLPMARPICPLLTMKISRPPFSSTMQSRTVAPLMFWKIEMSPSWSDESLIAGKLSR